MAFLFLANNSAHRTGQKKPVEVTRIIVKDSVEERILTLQEHKKQISAAALGDNDAGRLGKLSLQDLIGLFGTVTTRNGQMTVG
jgi:SNF2 family DNA or RNA helicase